MDADLLDRMAEWLRRHSWLKRHHAAHRTFNGKATLRAEAGASSLTLREEDGEFPDVNAVMPQGDTAFAVTLSAEVVENLCKLAKDMGDRMPTFTLEFTKLNMSDAACETAIRVVIDDRTRGAIMPVTKT